MRIRAIAAAVLTALVGLTAIGVNERSEPERRPAVLVRTVVPEVGPGDTPDVAGAILQAQDAYYAYAAEQERLAIEAHLAIEAERVEAERVERERQEALARQRAAPPAPRPAAPVVEAADYSGGSCDTVHWAAREIYMRESGCRPEATNPGGCRGIGQACPGSKLPCGSDFACQHSYFTGYAMSRYGSWEAAWAFWQRNHWW